MPDEQPSVSIDRELTTQIVAAYVRRNQVAPDQLGSLISAVHKALGQLGKPAEAVSSARAPAVSIRRSVHRDHVICLECGWRGQMLRRHIVGHGLSVDAYRARWGLPREHAIVALAYSERRSTMAKQIGLGRGGRRASGNAPEPAARESLAAQQPRRRGRPRSKATTTAPA